jgi:C-terminal domain 7 of the ABC-three component (ABC-3C) systems
MSAIDEKLQGAASGVGTAPGPYLGFSLQPVRLCARLLSAYEGDSVSTERMDDVAVHRANGTDLLEQDKSALSQNPVSDWAPDLWKTFANWLETTKRLQLDPANTDYVLYVVPVKTGATVAALHNARTPDQVEAIVAKLRASLAAKKPAPACAKDISAFLNAEPTLRAAIIVNFTLISQSDPLLEIRNHLASSVSPAVLDDICGAAIGWVLKTADSQLRSGKRAVIAVSDFRVRLRAIIKRQDRDHVLNSVAAEPEPTAIDAEVRRRVYIRQMELIECESDEKLRAASDFLRASTDRTHWSDRGLVDEQSLHEFDDRLERRWRSTKRSVSIQSTALSEAELGQLLMSECIKPAGDRLQGMDVPSHFPPGSVHALADKLNIGWHPRFKDLLNNTDGEKSNG